MSRRSFLVLACFATAFLSTPAVAEAAEGFGLLLAQSSAIASQRGPGLYLNLFKFIPVLALFLLWVATTHWVDEDTRELNILKFTMWNSVVFFSGLAGFALLWAIPIFPIGMLLLLLAYAVPLLTYVSVRNQMVPEDRKVLTPYHIGEVINGILNRLGMKGIFNRSETGIDKTGPPIHFIGKSQGGKIDPTLTERAEQSKVYMAAKELVYDAILRRSTDIHLEPTQEQMSVRYRIDGILHAAEPFDRPTGDAVVNIFKVLSAMDISEKRKPQDGSFAAKL